MLQIRSGLIKYLINISRKTSKLAFSWIVDKVVSEKNCFYSKKILWIKTSEKSQVVNPFFYNALDFESRILNVLDYEPKRVDKFRIQIFKLCQIWRKKFHKTSDFEVKLTCLIKNIEEYFAFRIAIWFLSPRENANFCSYAVS